MEEVLEENNDRLLKKKGGACVNSSEGEEATKPQQSSCTKTKSKKRSPSPSLSSSDESTCSTSPERKKKKKDPAKKYSCKNFLEGEGKVKTGDDLLLVGVKTVERIIEDEDDPLPCVKHQRMLTEKVAKNVYKVDSLCKYDAAVCKTAGLVGVKEFGNIKHDEMFSYFTYDNTVKAAGSQASESKSNKFKSRTKKYSDIICTRFKSEESCRLPCSFLNACMFCEARGHAKLDCTVYKKSKDSK